VFGLQENNSNKKSTAIFGPHCLRIQGDQIGRIFASWAFVVFGIFWKIKEVAQILGLLFSTV
jgi:hypothetical protein